MSDSGVHCGQRPPGSGTRAQLGEAEPSILQLDLRGSSQEGARTPKSHSGTRMAESHVFHLIRR